MLGTHDPQAELLDADALCGHLVEEGSIYRNLAALGDKLFTDADFADLYDARRGRHSVPPALLAKVVLLQSLEGTSDRESLDRVRRDIGWKVALGLSLVDEGFHPTVLCYFRERLRTSSNPRRIFDRFKAVGIEAGLLSKRGVRVLDSTPVLSAVQTQDTISLIRGALRRLLGLLERSYPTLAGQVITALRRDDYAKPGKPAIDWDDEAQRNNLVDELVTDALAALKALEGKDLDRQGSQAAELLATVAGQDVEEGGDGRFRIRRGVASNRVVSTVDPEARHGRKSRHGHFDGYKANVAVDPKAELITEVKITAGNVSDAQAIEDLLPELSEENDGTEDPVTVVADSAYGSGATRQVLEAAGVASVIKVPPEINSKGGFLKAAFRIDLEARTATCPAGVTTARFIQLHGGGRFRFPAEACASCLLRKRCTSSPRGRSVGIGPHEELLARARATQATPEFKAAYSSIRPTVERVIARLVRRGGRKARYRGREKVAGQLRMKAAAENFARMLRLGLVWTGNGWAVAR